MSEKSDISFKTRFSDDVVRDPAEAVLEEGGQPYRAVCKTAIISVAIAVLSVMVVLLSVDFGILTVIPLLGFVLGVVAYLKIKKWPDELTGRTAAFVGMAVCGLEFVGGVAWNRIYYFTEVPDDSIRVTWDELQPDEGSHAPVSQRALELHGKKVFIKGYVGAEDKRRNLKQFQLVANIDACCFGKKPKATHYMVVDLKKGLTVDYDMFPKRLTGILRVNLNIPEGKQGFLGYFRLEADRAW